MVRGTREQDGTDSPSPLVGEGARRADEGDGGSASSNLKSFARSMRNKPTQAEAELWFQLRNRRFAQFKFRRQVPIGPYIADFVCFERKLIVELDGSQHAESKSDEARDAELKRRGFEVLRIWNSDWYQSQTVALEAVWAALQDGENQ